VAALAPGVVAALEQGDAMAGAILDRAADELVGLVATLAKGADAGPAVAMSGGLLGETKPLRGRVVAGLERLEGIEVRPGELDAVKGAVVLWREGDPA
jgi:N-acetylglucosamine kinase-like BadF-type ATPase